jgi:leucyl-tRNA synthetase
MRCDHAPHAQAINEFSSDAMRWALADSGDHMDDANFETSTANAAILRITKELAWTEEMMAAGAGEVLGSPGGWHVCADCIG